MQYECRYQRSVLPLRLQMLHAACRLGARDFCHHWQSRMHDMKGVQENLQCSAALKPRTAVLSSGCPLAPLLQLGCRGGLPPQARPHP